MSAKHQSVACELPRSSVLPRSLEPRVKNSTFCFLQHIYRALQPGGRAAVVLPYNVLFQGNVRKSCTCPQASSTPRA